MLIRFDEWTWDQDARQLLRQGRRVEVSPRAFDLLGLLLQNRTRVVSKKEIGALLWPDTFVSSASLAVVVNELRRVLGDTRREARFIRTVHGRGYAFSADAVEMAPAGGRRPGDVSLELVFEGRVLPLAPGENLVGRGPESVIDIASTKVSRRHARIVVSGSRAFIEDLDSKNGTYVRGRPIGAATELKDGDTLSVGPVEFSFRVRAVRGSTETAFPRRGRRSRE